MGHNVTDGIQLYLPVSEATVRTVIERDPDIRPVLADRSLPELCSVFIIQHILDKREQLHPVSAIERLLADLIDDAKAVPVEGFLETMLTKLDPARLVAGLTKIGAEPSIALLSEAEIAQRHYLTAEKGWDFDYARRRHEAWQSERARYDLPGVRRILDDQQFRPAQILNAELDENLHVQGYAGTGKSTLIGELIALLLAHGVPPSQILVLTKTSLQQQAFTRDRAAPSGVTRITVGELAAQIMPKNLLDPTLQRLRHRSRLGHKLLPEQVAAYFGLAEIGQLTAVWLARAAIQTVSRYCFSDQEIVNDTHLPAWFRRWRESPRSPTGAMQTATVITTAEALWREILTPSPGFDPPVWVDHQIKYCALHGITLPSSFTHVIADESHDLSPAVRKILDSSPQACLTLADEYQNLSGSVPARKEHRSRELTLSHRAGQPLEQIVNPILSVHRIKPKALFVGNTQIPTEVRYYKVASLPEEPATIVVSNNWSMWAWLRHMDEKGVDFSLLGHDRDLDRFVVDCIELFHRGIRPRHWELRNYTTWDRVAYNQQDNRAFQRIQESLEQGYEQSDWRNTFARVKCGGANVYSIGTVESVKNADYETVMLSPETIEGLRTTDRDALAAAESAIYTAITRVKHKLIVPEDLRNWIEEYASDPVRI